jgi:hypothetical protein
MNTTLNIIRSHDPCPTGWQTLLVGLNKKQADDEPLALTRILEVNGLDDALWALRCVDDQRAFRLYAVACAREVQHLMTDPRSVAALDVTERYANGQATHDEMDAAWLAAWDVAWADARCAVGNPSRDAAWDAARAAALAAARCAVGNPSRYAAWDVAWADHARAAAWVSAGDVARDTMCVRQAELYVQFFGGES